MQKNRFLQQLDPAQKEQAEQQAPIAPSPNQFLGQLEGKEKPPEEEGWGKQALRKVLQPALTYFNAKYSWPLDVISAIGTGNAYGDMQELQSEIPRLKQMWPDADWDKVEKLTDEELKKHAYESAESFPTQHNVESFVEKQTGLPLEAKDDADKWLRLFGMGAGFGQGGVLSNAIGGASAATTSAYLQKAGAPEWLSDLTGLFLGHGIPSFGAKQTPKGLAESLIGQEPLETSTFKTAEAISKEAPEVIRSRQGPPTEPPAPNLPIPPVKPEPAPFLPKKAQPTPEPLYTDIKVEPLPEPKPVKVEVPKTPTSGEGELAGRVKKPAEPGKDVSDLGQVVSKEPLQSSAQTGRSLSAKIKDLSKEEKIPVTAAYKEAEAATAAHSDVYPKLVNSIDEFVKKLELIEKRNAAQEVVYQQAKTIQNMVGVPGAMLEENAQKLVLQADAMAQQVNYELPFTGYKGQIKGLVKDVDAAVIESLERAGKTAEAEKVRVADKKYAKWADRFLSDELTPYLERKNLNPESLFEKPTTDIATHRAVRKAIGNKSDVLIQRLDSNVVKKEMGKYYEKPELVNSSQYQKDLVDLSERIGSENAREVDYFLRDRQSQFSKKNAVKSEQESFVKRKLLEPAEKQAKKVESPKLNALADKISQQQKQLVEKKKVEIKNLDIERKNLERQRKYDTEIEHQKGTHEHRTKKEQAQYERKKAIYDRKVEDINQRHKKAVEESQKISAPSEDEIVEMMNRRSGIRKVKEIASENNFETIKRQKVRSIVTEGELRKNFRGKDLERVIKKENNHELLSELIGEEATDAALDAAIEIGSRRMTQENLQDFAEKAAALKFLYVIKDFIPI